MYMEYITKSEDAAGQDGRGEAGALRLAASKGRPPHGIPARHNLEMGEESSREPEDAHDLERRKLELVGPLGISLLSLGSLAEGYALRTLRLR